MKTAIVMLLLLSVCATANADTTSIRIPDGVDADIALFFVLGMLDDYKGRYLVVGRVEAFYPNEAHLADLLEKYLVHYADQKGLIANCERQIGKQGHITLNCPILADSIDAFYTLASGPTDDFVYMKRIPASPNEIGLARISSGRIKTASRAQRLAYLHGSFYRYGRTEQSRFWQDANTELWPDSDAEVWGYDFANSIDKFRLIRDMLKDIGCEIEFRQQLDTRPNGNYLKFIPTMDFQQWVANFAPDSFTFYDLRRKQNDLLKKKGS